MLRIRNTTGSIINLTRIVAPDMQLPVGTWVEVSLWNDEQDIPLDEEYISLVAATDIEVEVDGQTLTQQEAEDSSTPPIVTQIDHIKLDNIAATDHHNNVNDPTVDQKAALDATPELSASTPIATASGVNAHTSDLNNPHTTDLHKAQTAGNNLRVPFNIYDSTGATIIGQLDKAGAANPNLALWDSTGNQSAILQRSTGNFSISVLGSDAKALYKNCNIEVTQLGGTTASQMVRGSDSGDGQLFEFRADNTNQFYGKLDVDNDTRIGTHYASPYRFSIQRNTDQCWFEILNNGGVNKGGFFGMYLDNFELYNWQGGHINFYTHPNASQGAIRMQIKDTGPVALPGLAEGVVRTNALKELEANATTSHLPEGTNFYYTEARVNANTNVSANTTHRNITTGNPHSLDAADVGAIPSVEKGAINGVATLDASGKVPVTQIPAAAIPSMYVVADATARLALTVQEGDEARQTDDSSHWIYDGSSWIEYPSGGGGTGDVTGPSSSTDNAVARFDGATGKVVQNSIVIIDDSGNVSGVGTVDGRDVSADGTALDNHVADLVNPHATDISNLGSGTLAQLNTKVTDATLDTNTASRPPTTHSLGGSEHSSTSLASLNTLVMGGDLDFSTAPRTPTSHTHLASEVTNFDTEVSNNTNVAANTIHSGLTFGNPHNVTKTEVGLGSVTNDAQLTRGDDDWVGFSTKGEVVDTDRFLIEDSENGWEKTKVPASLIKDIVQDGDAISAYDSSGGTSITSGWTDIPLNAEHVKTSIFTHSLGSAEVIITQAGRFGIDARVSCDITSGNSRSDSQMRILRDQGSGYVGVPGTLTPMYNRTASQGGDNGSAHVVLDVSVGDKIKIQARRRTGGSLIALTAHGSSLVITSNRGPTGQQGPAGAGGVSIEDTGAQVPNGPHTTLNFVGAGVSVVDDGNNGQANITIPGGYGNDFQSVSSTGVGSTSGTFFVHKTNLTWTPSASGTYKISYSASMSVASLEKWAEYRLTHGLSTVYNQAGIECVKFDYSDGFWAPISGFFFITVTAVPQVIYLDFRSATAGVTSGMKDAHITAEKVA